MKKLILIISILFLINLNSAYAQNENVCTVYFTGIGCPNCQLTDPIILGELPKKYPNLIIIEYELYHQAENSPIMGEYVSSYSLYPAVPQMVLDKNKIFIGRIEVLEAEEEIKKLSSNPYPLVDGSSVDFNDLDITSLPGKPNIWANERILISPGEGGDNELLKSLLIAENLSTVLENVEFEIIEPQAVPLSGSEIEFENAIKINNWIFQWNKEVIIPSSGETNETEISNEINENIVEIPFFGEVDITKMSLPALTIILGGADGFNPCAFFVLTFLLSMLIHAGSRKRIFLVGSIFVFFSGLIYFLFMCAWLNVFLLAGEIAILTLIAGIIAVITGLINIKDFFFFKKGVSLTLPEKQKLSLPEKVRNLMKSDSLLTLGIGAALFAITVNLYELLCTFGFPVLFTRALTLHELPTIQYYLYLIFYNIIYVIPISIIVIIFALTLGARKFGVEQVKMLKLMSGLMILFLGSILIFEPHLLENILISIGVIVFAVLLSGLIIAVKRILKKKSI